jgi:hypothetical protein
MLNAPFSYFYNNFFCHQMPFCAKVRQRPASLQQIHAASRQIPAVRPHDSAPILYRPHVMAPSPEQPPPWLSRPLYLSYEVGPPSLSKTNAVADIFGPATMTEHPRRVPFRKLFNGLKPQ